MACSRGVILGLSTLFVFAKAISEDFDASGAFRFEPFKLGGPKTLNSTRFPSCEKQPGTGYVCCDQRLKEIILSTMKELDEEGSGVSKGLGYSKCNIHNMATKMQRRSETELGHLIEAIVAVGSFENKANVLNNMICKIRVEDKHILLYAADTIIETTTTTTTTTTPHPLRQGCGEVKKIL